MKTARQVLLEAVIRWEDDTQTAEVPVQVKASLRDALRRSLRRHSLDAQPRLPSIPLLVYEQNPSCLPVTTISRAPPTHLLRQT